MSYNMVPLMGNDRHAISTPAPPPFLQTVVIICPVYDEAVNTSWQTIITECSSSLSGQLWCHTQRLFCCEELFNSQAISQASISSLST